jgi:capsular exopolysaccharide synthesis family protein
MSRLFEALQRSESERSGTDMSEPPVSAATELVEAAEQEKPEFREFPSVHVIVTPDKRLVTLTAEGSLGAEKFRFLGVRLRHAQQNRGIKKLVVTSTMAEEGKSLVAANLAVALAQKRQQKVLLLEGDLRRPSLAQTFGIKKLPGLSEWVQDGKSPAARLYHLEEPGFWFLPAGSTPDNALALMQPGKLSEILDQLSTWFDWIVIDSPPLLPLADTSVWMRLADGVLLVAREGKVERRQFKKGLEAVKTSSLIGIVLNDAKTADQSDYYQHYYLASPHPKKDEAK